MKKLFRDGRATFQMVFRLIRWDPQTLLLFEFLYRLLSLTILTPLIKMVLQWGIEQSGVLVLSQFNLLSVLRKPWCILLFLLLGLVMVFYEFIEITVIILFRCRPPEREDNAMGAFAAFLETGFTHRVAAESLPIALRRSCHSADESDTGLQSVFLPSDSRIRFRVCDVDQHVPYSLSCIDGIGGRHLFSLDLQHS